ncbi:MAG: ArsA family ATPase [Deltaproteobacteria bacterium]|nr:ArsA family ATPase [Deltaproteobacteria bacterium]
MSDDGARRFEIVIGKGGVGRTTVAASIALASSRAGLGTLLATTGSKERVSHMIGPPPVGLVNTTISSTLDAVALEPWACIEEYTLMMLRLRSLQRIVFGNRFMKNFVTGIPGIYEWAILGKATYHVMEKKRRRPVYDRIVLDAPATGHGLALLRVPLLIRTAVSSGPVLRDANERWKLMADPETTRIVLVTLAEEMVVTETLQLRDELIDELGLEVGLVVVNKVIPPLFDRHDEEKILSIVKNGGSDERMRAAALRIHRSRIQRAQIKRLHAGMEAPFLELPLLATRRFSKKALGRLAPSFEPTPAVEFSDAGT